MSTNTYNLKIAIPDKAYVLGVVVMTKYMDADGEIRYSEGGEGNLSPLEKVGMLTSFLDSIRHQITKAQRK